jgi:hypothetical protein
MVDKEKESGSHEHEQPPAAPPIVQPIVEASDELVAPVIDHAEKIVRIEERQAQHQREMIEQLAQLEERLLHASSSQIDGLMTRINDLESNTAKSTESAMPDESIELELPEVEPSPAPPEKLKQGMRHRRKAKKLRNS